VVHEVVHEVKSGTRICLKTICPLN